LGDIQLDIEVTLKDFMGSDLTVVNAARVSFDKESDWEKGFDNDLEGLLNYSDEKLIKYLAKHNHWSPFGHASIQFRIKAPVFVARQLVKHQIGLTWNEVSRRYVSDDPSIYCPDTWRAAASDKKQGSDEEKTVEWIKDSYPDDEDIRVGTVYNKAVEHAVKAYDMLIEGGVAPEQARMVLPQSMFTEWYWSGTLYAFARVCNLRCKPDAQYETRVVANKIDKLAQDMFPVSWECLRT
jgi:thymidylate synthase (FAD)